MKTVFIGFMLVAALGNSQRTQLIVVALLTNDHSVAAFLLRA